MRKIKILLMSLLLLFFITISIKVNAENKDIKFIGTIKQKYDFMVGDYISNSDFIIDGYLQNGNEIIKSEDLGIGVSYMQSTLNFGTNMFKFNIFKKTNESVWCNVETPINIQPFDSKLQYVNDNKKLITTKLSWKSDDGFDTIMYFNEISKIATTRYGKPIDGNMKFSDDIYRLKYGYNYIKYRFIPYDNKYDTLYGDFTILYNPKPKINIKQQSFSVSVDKNKFRLLVNGKVQNGLSYGKAKPNTEYEIEVQQKETQDGKNITVWSGTITTKK